MAPHRKTAIVVGILFIVATVAGVLSMLPLGSLLDEPVDLGEIASHEAGIVGGAILQLIMGFSAVGIASAMFTIFRVHKPGVAAWYLSARTLECGTFIIGVVGLLSLLTVSQDYVAGTLDASAAQASGTMALAVIDWTALLGSYVAYALGALLFFYLLYKVRLVPRWLSAWGFVGAVLWLPVAVLVMSGTSDTSALALGLTLPLAVNEMVLAVWLLVKGFNPAAVAVEPSTA